MRLHKIITPAIIALVISCKQNTPNDGIKNIYPAEQTTFVDTYDSLDSELKKASGNSILSDEALNRRNHFSNNVKHVNNWIGTITDFGGYSGNYIVRCSGYKYESYELLITDPNVPNEELKKFLTGRRVMFTGDKDGIYITNFQCSFIK